MVRKLKIMFIILVCIEFHPQILSANQYLLKTYDYDTKFLFSSAHLIHIEYFNTHLVYSLNRLCLIKSA